ncbi:MAG: hypothetical protein EAX96_11040 [Candidatus Lokiarchaeota archaeon]|nr:hypothetical protein [Candidatus Lokiarchaeota archaeon]
MKKHNLGWYSVILVALIAISFIIIPSGIVYTFYFFQYAICVFLVLGGPLLLIWFVLKNDEGDLDYSKEIKCLKCGYSNPNGIIYCKSCGKTIKSRETSNST